MIGKFKSWLADRFSTGDPTPTADFRKTGAHVSPRPKKKAEPNPAEDFVEVETSMSGRIDDAGPGKSVLIRNKYVREDTGTHETLKILDDSLVDSGEETGIDPYNTGGFDRSKNWNNRFRK
jgi:hypothetical protein